VALLEGIVAEDLLDDARRVPFVKRERAAGEAQTLGAVFTTDQFSGRVDDQQIIERTTTRRAE
jgi:hypothetical protein